MNKKVLFVVLLILLLLGLGAGFWFMKGKSPANQTSSGNPEPTRSVAQEVPTSSPTRSLRDLLTAGVAQKCTFSTENSAGSGTGTFLISGGKVRGEVASTVEGKNVLMHMIVDGTTSYVWMGDETTGFKMTLDPQDKAAPSGAPKNSGIDPDADLNYNCTPWVADSAQFVIPQNVKFSDFSSMIKPAVSGAAVDKCAACSYLSGDAKAQCLTTLGCSN